MPIFGSKFSPKKTPSRKNITSVNESIEELFGENRTVSLTLGHQESVFHDGEWTPANGDSGHQYKHTRKLKNKIADLQEENNMLRLKYELMLNMLTQTTAESHVQQREMQKLNEQKKRNK